MEMDDWKTCDGCKHKVESESKTVLHRDIFDRMKRMRSGEELEQMVASATHRGNWVTLIDMVNVCEFDDKLCIPDGIFHHCPWHWKELPEGDNWWE